MMHTKQDKPQQATAVAAFLRLGVANGDKMADDLDYVPLPDSVVALIRQQWAKITDDAGKPDPSQVVLSLLLPAFAALGLPS